MARFLLLRLLYAIGTLWVVATVTFVLMRVTPGGPFDRERRLPPEVLANIAVKYRLDDPWPRQYLRYLKEIAKGDLGPSYKYPDRNVRDIILSTFPVSASLGFMALLVALAFSLSTGLLAASRRDSWIDRACLLIATLGIALPHFVLGGAVIWLFSLHLGLLPPAGWGSIPAFVLPILTLASGPAAYLASLLRSTLLETLDDDFIRTARAKGLPESLVLLKHALSNSLIPTLSALGPLIAVMLTGSFVVEYIFAIPGMGRFFITAVTDRDYPLIMGVTLIYTAVLVCANFLVDLAYSWLDPRIKVS
jgi:ABC-type dipeptide/oligopeptide/nickel transport system permease component